MGSNQTSLRVVQKKGIRAGDKQYHRSFYLRTMILIKPRFTAGFGKDLGNVGGKSGFAVNRDFVCLQYVYYY